MDVVVTVYDIMEQLSIPKSKIQNNTRGQVRRIKNKINETKTTAKRIRLNVLYVRVGGIHSPAPSERYRVLSTMPAL